MKNKKVFSKSLRPSFTKGGKYETSDHQRKDYLFSMSQCWEYLVLCVLQTYDNRLLLTSFSLILIVFAYQRDLPPNHYLNRFSPRSLIYLIVFIQRSPFWGFSRLGLVNISFEIQDTLWFVMHDHAYRFIVSTTENQVKVSNG